MLCEALQTTLTHDEKDEECTDLCLKPIDSGDCDYIWSLGLTILPCSGMSTPYERETNTDQVCAGTGTCGTSMDLNNRGNEDLYMRVESFSDASHDFWTSCYVGNHHKIMMMSLPWLLCGRQVKKRSVVSIAQSNHFTYNVLKSMFNTNFSSKFL
eukprot:scaffold102865_cov64-Cyclotella_meneghiniana.AAC.2